MKLTHLPLGQLKLSAVNVRSTGGKEIADLLPSIRSLGIIQPLLGPTRRPASSRAARSISAGP